VATYGAECWTVKWDIDKGLATFEILKINKKIEIQVRRQSWLVRFFKDK
jgi:hypothetical protein